MDQPADQLASNGLGHRPTRRRTVWRAERAIALGEYAFRRRDEDTVDAGRVGEQTLAK